MMVQLDPGIEPPTYAHPGDAGADLRTTEDFELGPGERRLVGTGIAIALPAGYAAFVHPRSGLAARHGISIVNTPGTVDAGYRGEIKVCVVNTDRQAAVRFSRGDRIAQLVVQPVSTARFVPVAALDETARAELAVTGRRAEYWTALQRTALQGTVRQGKFNRAIESDRYEWAGWDRMIFGRDKKRKGDAADDEAASEAAEVTEATDGEEPTDDATRPLMTTAAATPDLADLDSRDWRGAGPYDIAEVDDVESNENGPRIDLGSMILTGVPGSELRLQVAEDTQQIVSAMLIIETIVEAPAGTKERVQQLLLGARTRRVRGTAQRWPLDGVARRDRRRRHRSRRLGVARGRPVRGRAASPGAGDHPRRRGGLPALADVGRRGAAVAASRHRLRSGGDRGGPRFAGGRRRADPPSGRSIIRRGDEAMAPGDLLPLTMPADLVSDEEA